jgi:hypothetical protein
VDITICVMLPPRGSSDFNVPGNAHYPMLGVVAVYPYMDETAVVTAPHTGSVCVTGVPDDKYARIKEVLERGDDGLKRIWAGVASRIPVNARNRLATDRKITVTWTQFRNFLRNLREQRDFTDADLD